MLILPDIVRRRRVVCGNNFAATQNIVCRNNGRRRMGVARTRRGARQLVSHRHITVNGQLVNIPSYQLQPGDEVAVREKSKSLSAIDDALSSNDKVYDFITFNKASMKGTFVSVPERLQIPENIKEQLIVELYSK